MLFINLQHFYISFTLVPIVFCANFCPSMTLLLFEIESFCFITSCATIAPHVLSLITIELTAIAGSSWLALAEFLECQLCGSWTNWKALFLTWWETKLRLICSEVQTVNHCKIVDILYIVTSYTGLGNPMKFCHLDLKSDGKSLLYESNDLQLLQFHLFLHIFTTANFSRFGAKCVWFGTCASALIVQYTQHAFRQIFYLI